jgi:FlaA1/EpsC-like NDP-sugar epimerase
MSLNIRRTGILLLHVVLVCFAAVSAWALRFEFHLPNLRLLLILLPILVVYRLAAFARFGLLHGYWRYTGLHDGIDMLKALLLSSAAFLLCIRYFLRIKVFPLSVYCLELLLAAFVLLGVRLLYRAFMQSKPVAPGPDRRRSRRVLIVGAGFAAQLLIRELKQAGPAWIVVGCVDDEKSKVGSKVHGVPVLGAIDQLPGLCAKNRAFEVLIAMPSATAAQMQRVVQTCYGARLRYRTIPSLREFVAGQSSLGQLREVKLDDLLGRDPVHLDLEPVRRMISGTPVLVTGAAGSIGSELACQLLQSRPSVLVCLDQDESGLFELQQRLSQFNSDSKVEFCIADVNDTNRVETILSRFSIITVFHAAAYKHVPLTESNVSEALRNNVFGLISMLDAAETCHCSSFVLISSDKAVNPSSFMGSTKRLGELILAARPTSNMRCVTVRFGNVLGSQGSVVPLFQQQIRTMRRITVTHPDITRYFMTIPEAVALVLQAFAAGEHRDLLVLDMGKPVQIVDLANTLVKLSGIPENEIEISFTGLRPGEKLYEELFYQHEEPTATSVGKIMRAKTSTISWETLTWHLNALHTMVGNDTEVAIRARMKQIIPEYSYTSVAETDDASNRMMLPLSVASAD